jgi:SAM-dependent methyltransferase
MISERRKRGTMAERDPDADARRLADAAVARGEETGWFEELYVAAEAGDAVVPWDHREPQQLVEGWVRRRGPAGSGRRAVVVGCGLGRDAELVGAMGYSTVAFDLSQTAVRIARARFPDSPVQYVAADLFELPVGWHEAFDLVVESLTVQSLPPTLRTQAIAHVRSLVALEGSLLVVAAAQPESAPGGAGPPWPLTRDDIAAFARDGLEEVEAALVPDPVDTSLHRWCVELTRLRPGGR